MLSERKLDEESREGMTQEFEALMGTSIPLGKLKGQKLEVLLKNPSHQRYTDWILAEMPDSSLAKNILRARMLWGLVDEKQKSISTFMKQLRSGDSPPFRHKKRILCSVVDAEVEAAVLTQPLLRRGTGPPRKHRRVETPGESTGVLIFSRAGVAELEKKLKTFLPKDEFDSLLQDRDRFLKNTGVSDGPDSTKNLANAVFITLPVQNSPSLKAQILANFDSFRTQGLKQALTSLWGWSQLKSLE